MMLQLTKTILTIIAFTWEIAPNDPDQQVHFVLLVILLGQLKHMHMTHPSKKNLIKNTLTPYKNPKNETINTFFPSHFFDASPPITLF